MRGWSTSCTLLIGVIYPSLILKKDEMRDEKGEREREDERKTESQREAKTELEEEDDLKSPEHTQHGLTRQPRPFILWWPLCHP